MKAENGETGWLEESRVEPEGLQEVLNVELLENTD
jgi:hypothetical protein